ncbi:MAG: hypothetical protein RLZZ618_3117, partial [Pseudomonadota bacterium]
SRVHALFTALGYPDTVATELTALCTTATPEPVLRRLFEAGSLRWAQLPCLREPHLPQGAPTSAALANLCAFRLDLRIDGLAHALGARYTRYADDLVLSGDLHLIAAMPRIRARVARIAAEEDFSLNPQKTRCLKSGRRQSVCSVVVNQHPNLPRPEFDRLKAILHQCVQQGPSSQNRDGHPPLAAAPARSSCMGLATQSSQRRAAAAGAEANRLAPMQLVTDPRPTRFPHQLVQTPRALPRVR